MNTQNNNQGAQQREIPVPPGGGSWRFDEAAWGWVSTDPVPEQAPAADNPLATDEPAALIASEE